MPNFSFLASKPEYALFAPACVEAEKIFASAPTLCAVGCRKALELWGSMPPLIIISHGFEKPETLKKALMQEYFR